MSILNEYLTLLSITKDEWEAMQGPISQESPTGESLAYEGAYDNIREARRYDDPSLPQGDWQHKLKKADWNKVRLLCIEALSFRSKDLQLAVWFTEALLHQHGYVGLKAGLQLIIHLCENFWDDLYPPLEENGDMELRISPLVWLNEKLSIQLGYTPITSPATDDILSYSFFDRENAWLLENKSVQEKQAAEAESKPTQTKFLTSVTLTPRSFYVTVTDDLHESIELIDALNKLLNESCGKQAPSLGRFRDTLENIHYVVNVIVQQKPTEEVETEETDAGEDGEIDGTASGTVNHLPLVRNRQEAYRRLAEAADYLMQTEPHSPTPYLVRRAIGWGNMSLTELLMELVGNENDLRTIYHLLGIKFDKE